MESTVSASLNITRIKLYSEIFQSIAIGIGALCASFGGLKIFLEWRAEGKKKSYLVRLKSKYPRENLNKDYILADISKAPGRYYILDKRDKTRHWIETFETLLDLGLHSIDGKTVLEKDFNKYKESFSIITRRV